MGKRLVAAVFIVSMCAASGSVFAGTDVNLNIGISAGKPAPPAPSVVVVKPAPVVVKKDNGKHLGQYKEKGKKGRKH